MADAAQRFDSASAAENDLKRAQRHRARTCQNADLCKTPSKKFPALRRKSPIRSSPGTRRKNLGPKHWVFRFWNCFKPLNGLRSKPPMLHKIRGGIPANSSPLSTSEFGIIWPL